MNLAAVQQFIGKPWSYPDNDCWQLFRRSAADVFGIQIPDVGVPLTRNESEAAQLFEQYSAERYWRRIDSLKPGCAVLFRSKLTGTVIHIGLHVHNGNILHCAERINCRYDHIGLLRRLFGGTEYYEYLPDRNI